MLSIYMSAADNQPTAFGARLRAHRTDRKLTQNQLADLAGTSRQSIGNWETGRWGISPEALDKLAAALDLSPAELHPNPDSLRLEGGGIGTPKGNPATGSHESRITALEGEVRSLRAALAAHEIIDPQHDDQAQELEAHAEKHEQQQRGTAGRSSGRPRRARGS
jgi:transcriptional regulator with XRE-family HTH domain